MDKSSRYYVDGTDFEVRNCPAYVHGNCKVNPSVEKGFCRCKDMKDCMIKSHCVGLSALIAVTTPGSAENVGAKSCLDSFLVTKD